MSVGFLYEASEWKLALLFLIVMLAAVEAGFRLGRKAGPRTSEAVKALVSVLEGAMLGVLGLILGFTMSMAVSRFEIRKQLVLDEANAIGTSYLRTRLLPAPEGTDIANALRQYVGVRLEHANAGNDFERLQATREQGARLQTEFWGRATDYARKDPNMVKAGLLLQSLNQAIDLEAARQMASLNHVPDSVIYVNGIVAALAATLVGYAFGIAGRRQMFSTFVLAVAITLVLFVIVDLDQPYKGFIHVSQQPMVDLQRQLQSRPGD